MKKTQKPQSGTEPRSLFEEQRIEELKATIVRSLRTDWPIPTEIIEEYNELVDKLPFDNP